MATLGLKKKIQNICFERMDASYNNLNIFDHVHFSLHCIFQILIFPAAFVCCLLPSTSAGGMEVGGCCTALYGLGDGVEEGPG